MKIEMKMNRSSQSFYTKTARIFFGIVGIIALMSGATLNAQVTFGQEKDPEDFSILELVSNSNLGLRLPQMTASERTAMEQSADFQAEKTGKAMGLQIFNMTTKCINIWNGAKWIEKCALVTLTYDANGGSGAPAPQEGVPGGTIILSDGAGMTNADKIFAGWNTKSDNSGTGYGARAGYTLPDRNVTLYAQWVTPPPDKDATPAPNTYVGAFWRNDQTGERIIRIPYVWEIGGAWRAIAMDPWIVLSTTPSADRGITYTSNESPADMNVSDAIYRVTDGSGSVSGYLQTDGYIYFRIGLTGTNPNPKSADYRDRNGNACSPPRYGRILLQYGNNTKSQYIYIRQGEAADKITNPFAIYYTVYNLMDPGVKTDPNYERRDFTRYSEHGSVGPNAGVWTDYPSQTGSLFHFSTTNDGAIHPTKPGSGISISGWPKDDKTLPQNRCPQGYYIPTWNHVSVGAAQIFPNEGLASNENTLWGYYADGFFDRRLIINDAVSRNNALVAYIGKLFINSYSPYSSVFYPASGSRHTNSGALLENSGGSTAGLGRAGYYWSSTPMSNNTRNGYAMYVAGAKVGASNYYDRWGISLRCVRK
jgi:hypothetical protein